MKSRCMAARPSPAHSSPPTPLRCDFSQLPLLHALVARGALPLAFHRAAGVSQRQPQPGLALHCCFLIRMRLMGVSPSSLQPGSHALSRWAHSTAPGGGEHGVQPPHPQAGGPGPRPLRYGPLSLKSQAETQPQPAAPEPRPRLELTSLRTRPHLPSWGLELLLLCPTPACAHQLHPALGTQQEPCVLQVCDSILNIGPCANAAMGEPAFLSEEVCTWALTLQLCSMFCGIWGCLALWGWLQCMLRGVGRCRRSWAAWPLGFELGMGLGVGPRAAGEGGRSKEQSCQCSHRVLGPSTCCPGFLGQPGCGEGDGEDKP